VRCRINQGAARARRPAVVGRGLSEGLGLARVAAEVASGFLDAKGRQPWRCALRASTSWLGVLKHGSELVLVRSARPLARRTMAR
jgi:hypothetical protein